MHSDAILKRLLSLHPKVIDLSLDRLNRLLATLDHPEKRIPPVIHVAGTNGKGSVCAMIRAGLEAAGHLVHAYSSPHLVRFHERIRLAGTLIDEDALSDLLQECEQANGDAPITFFEITTAAAFLAFSRTPADYTILEVGLGGRLDATNVIDDPRLCIITPVSLDHQQYLGHTVKDIAFEKAGILKPAIPCIVGPQPPEAQQAIETVARELDTPLHCAGSDWDVWLEHNTRLVFQNTKGLLDLSKPALHGAHQVANAGMAIAALRELGLSQDACDKAVTQAVWPGRLQLLQSRTLQAQLPNGAEVWLDGGHNEAAGRALGLFFADLSEKRPAPLYVICGMLNTKNPQAFMAPFKGLARQLIGMTIDGEENALPADAIQEHALKANLFATTAQSLQDALADIQTAHQDDVTPPRVLICGSLYLAGQVLRQYDA